MSHEWITALINTPSPLKYFCSPCFKGCNYDQLIKRVFPIDALHWIERLNPLEANHSAFMHRLKPRYSISKGLLCVYIFTSIYFYPLSKSPPVQVQEMSESDSSHLDHLSVFCIFTPRPNPCRMHTVERDNTVLHTSFACFLKGHKLCFNKTQADSLTGYFF